MSVNEQQLENLAINWFGELGWQYANGPDIAPNSEQPARRGYRQVDLHECLLATLSRINLHIPAATLEQVI